MDESLRKILRQVDNADPASFLPAARALSRAGAPVEICGDLLERLLKLYEAVYSRGVDSYFEIAWHFKGKERRGLRLTLQPGGLILVCPGQPGIAVDLGENPDLYYLFHLIITHNRLAPSTRQLSAALMDAIASNQIVSFAERKVSSEHFMFLVEKSFDVTAKVDPKRSWEPDYHLKFRLLRSIYRDYLEVSIQDVLYWGSPEEVQGMILTGTSYTVYDGIRPEDRDPPEPEDRERPYSVYEKIDNLQEIEGLVREIFVRFRNI